MLERLILALVAVWVAQVTGDCGKPPRMENGILSEEDLARNSFPAGTRVTYRCLVGYVFGSGSKRYTLCQADSTWTPLQGRCEPKNCGNPGEILNGYYQADATTLGSKAMFYCDEGYRIVGTNYRLCTADGWNGQVPTCEIVECSRPVTPAHAYVERGFGHKYKYQQEVVFRCNEGFEMIGASVIKCNENSIFEPSPPICRLPPTSTPTPTTTIVPATATAAVLTTVSTKSWADVTIKPTAEASTLSTGAIVGIIIVIIVAGIIIVVIVKCWCKKKEGQYTTPEKVVHEVQLC
ncbi:complement decay-accelerating factor-like isoform X5 [Chiloscyllium plagiosum]|uniref:complement decay-accelerating factor-like isoform X5 n=1 Tax=Chiloscyllium plagiosum TaxID=36176 RepID=UPI001CB8199F|nr:complement decay-accelerating factor-like isoform X5 [Chiloscyllium plagiosum]